MFRSTFALLLCLCISQVVSQIPEGGGEVKVSSSPYQIPFKLSQGEYFVSFDLTGLSNQDSKIQVKWNGSLFMTLIPSFNQTYRQFMLLQSTGNQSNLTFTGVSQSNSSVATIANLRFQKIDHAVVNASKLQKNNTLEKFGATELFSYSPKNLLRNGDFEESAVGGQTVMNSTLRDWQVNSNGFSIGKSAEYNSGWDNPNSTVIQLDTNNGNAEYVTSFVGRETNYYISFDFASHEGSPLQTSQFSIKVNGKTAFNFTPHSYSVQHQYLKVSGRNGNNTLAFKGEAVSDAKGATIDNIEVHEQVNPANESNRLSGKKSNDKGQFVQRKIPKNIVSNGAFQLEQLPMEKKKDVNDLKNWIVVGTGKLTQGSLHNQGWGDTAVVAELSKGVEYHLPLHLRKGNYTIQFDWAPREGKPRKSSLMLMKWNEYRVGQIIARSDQVRSITYVCRTDGFPRNFSLIGIGSSEDYGSAFTNFRVYQLQMTNYPLRARIYSCVLLLLEIKQDFIENGDFEFIPNFNVTEKKLFTGQFVPGWDVEGQGEIGKGKMFNSDWNPQTNVVELDSTENVEYVTKINGNKKKLILSFDYAPYQDKPLATSSLSISLNGKKTLNIIPDTDRVRRQIVELNFEGGDSNTIGFRGEGTSDGSGATIDNVQVRELK